jgi:hypothetical protein
MLTGLLGTKLSKCLRIRTDTDYILAGPGSPGSQLPAPNAPTTSGEAALVGGGAVANTANELGDRIAAGQDLGGHDPKGVKENEQARLEKEATGNIISPESANTAARFMNAGIPTPVSMFQFVPEELWLIPL